MRYSVIAAVGIGFTISALGAGCESFAGTNNNSPAPSDAGSEAGRAASDAGATPTDDSGTTEPDGGVSTFCAQQTPAPIFCADFDTSSDVRAGWGQTDLPTSGATLTAGTVAKGGQSLHATTTSADHASLKQLVTMGDKLVVAFDFQLVKVTSSSFDNAVSPIVITSESATQSIYFFTDSEKSYFQIGELDFDNDDYGADIKPPAKPGEWHHVVITITNGTDSTTHSRGTYDTNTTSAPDGALQIPWPQGTKLSIQVGVADIDGSDHEDELYIDNVIVTGY